MILKSRSMLATAEPGLRDKDEGMSENGAAFMHPHLRADHWLEEFRTEFRRRGLLDKCLEAIERGLEAKTTIRAADPSACREWNYKWVPDHAIQLTAARLALAYSAGNPPTQADVRLTGGVPVENAKADVADRLRELKECGISLEVIADVLKRESERLTAYDVTPESMPSVPGV